MGMSKKNYEQVAWAINGARLDTLVALLEQHGAKTAGDVPAAEWERLSIKATGALRNAATRMAKHFAQDNPNFNREQFMDACGFPNNQLTN